VPGDVGKVVAIYSSGAWDMFEFSVYMFLGFWVGRSDLPKKKNGQLIAHLAAAV